MFFIMALGEEAGWMGYAFDQMKNKLGTLKAADEM
jgi:membrane protease YdiL (CAAX protease family)